MEPLLTALFVAGSTKLFKALAGGEEVGRKEIADIATAMFEALLKLQKQDESLKRIEAKLDRSLRQDFYGPYGMGLNFLRDASYENDASAQGEAFKSARLRFHEAAAGVEDRGLKVRALHAASGCSLLAGRPSVARSELDQAWREAFGLMRSIAQLWDDPDPNRRPAPVSEFFFNTASTKILSARAEMEAEVSPLREIVGDIQRMRLALGSPEAECPILEIPPQNRNLRPLRLRAVSARVDLPDGTSVRMIPEGITNGDGLRVSAMIKWAQHPGMVFPVAMYPADPHEARWLGTNADVKYKETSWWDDELHSVPMKKTLPSNQVAVVGFWDYSEKTRPGVEPYIIISFLPEKIKVLGLLGR